MEIVKVDGAQISFKEQGEKSVPFPQVFQIVWYNKSNLVSKLDKYQGNQRATTHSAGSSRTTNATHNRFTSLNIILISGGCERPANAIHSSFYHGLRPISGRRLIRYRTAPTQNNIFRREPYPWSRTSRIFLIVILSQHWATLPP